MFVDRIVEISAEFKETLSENGARGRNAMGPSHQREIVVYIFSGCATRFFFMRAVIGEEGMPFRFSDSKEVDIDQLLELYRSADWAKNRTAEEADAVLSHSSLVFTLWEEERLAAFARVLTDFIFRAAIYDVIVHPRVQRKGVGRALIDKVLTYPALKKVPVFHLLTRDKRAFYEKLGFVAAQERGYSAMILVRNNEKNKGAPLK